ncbi:MAG: YdeI/OmpD-associated family protein [Jiangellaceae bacterium]
MSRRGRVTGPSVGSRAQSSRLGSNSQCHGSGFDPPGRAHSGYRNSVAVMGGEFMLGVSAEHREGAGVAAGDEVDVDLELDTEPREVTVPPDFAEALDGDADARRHFDGLSYSNQLRHVLTIEGSKTAETQQRRIANAVGMFREGRS